MERAATVIAVSAPLLTERAETDAGGVPLATYLMRLGGVESRRVMRSSLDAIAGALSGGQLDAEALPWHLLRYEHTSAARAWLGERYAPSTADHHLAALRGVLRECWRLGLVDAETYQRAVDLAPIRGQRLPRGRALAAGELRAVFASCLADGSPRGARDAAVVGLLYGAGLRRSEAVGLDLGDVDLESGRVRVRRGKGRKQRLSYLPAGGRAAVAAWLGVREAAGITAPPLLLPIRRGGAHIEERRLSDQAVADIVERLTREARLTEPAAPHDYRRSFIGDLLDAGADLSAAQQLAGHASPATTARYDRRGERAKQKAADLLHVPYRG